MGRAATRPLADAPSLGILDGFLGYNLKRVYMLVHAGFREAQGEDGLSPRAFSTLALAVEQPGITQSDLARTLGIERSGLVAIVDALESDGLLYRAPVPGDRRVQALFATEKGCGFFRGAAQKVRAHEAALMAALSEDEQAQLIELLQRVRQHHQGEERE